MTATSGILSAAGCDLYQPGGEESFELYRCLSCGQVMQNPLPTPEQLSKAYSAEYAPYRPAWKETGWPLWKVFRELTTRRRMRRLRRYGTGSKLLEVGCGAGDFLHAAHRAGWEVAAVEYSAALADELRRRAGLRCACRRVDARSLATAVPSTWWRSLA